MKLIIHGGRHKTGTTSFQAWLIENTDTLGEMGIYVPPMVWLSHGYELTAAARSGERRTGIWQSLGQARDDGYRLAIITGEAVSQFTQDEMGAFFDDCADFDHRLFFVLRSWESGLESHFAQNVRYADWITFPAYMERLKEDYETHPDANMGLCFARAVTAGFRNVTALPYGKDTALDFFCQYAGLSDGDCAALGPANPRQHASLAPERRERLRLLNAIIGTQQGLPEDQSYRSVFPPRDAGKPLRLLKFLEVLEADEVDVVNQLQSLVRDTALTVDMGDYVGLFERWRSDLFDALAQMAVDNRLSDHWAQGDAPAVFATSATIEDISADFSEQVMQYYRQQKQKPVGS